MSKAATVGAGLVSAFGTLCVLGLAAGVTALLAKIVGVDVLDALAGALLWYVGYFLTCKWVAFVLSPLLPKDETE